MTSSNVKLLLKPLLPVPLRRLMRGVLHYMQRVGRWGIILWQVRGVTWGDQWTLIRSALAAPLVSTRRLLEWQDPLLLSDVVVKVSGVGRFRLRGRCDDLWHVLPWRERHIVRFLRNHLRKGDVFIDAGANIGFYSVLAASLVGEKGNVVAIEMMPDTASRLTKNLGLNGSAHVAVVQKALSGQAGEKVRAEVIPGKFGQASIAESKDSAAATMIEVETTTLDELDRQFGGIGRVKVLKLDLEGAEEAALQGAGNLLDKTDFAVYESWGRSRREGTVVDRLFESCGFDLEQLDGNNWVAKKRHID